MKRSTSILVLFFLLSGLVSGCRSGHKFSIDLSGEWTVWLDSTDTGMADSLFVRQGQDKINLPGTTDMAGLGHKNVLEPSLDAPQILHLTRAYSYVGPAWYVRNVNVPRCWAGRCAFLELERVIWRTDVWVDGVKVEGHSESLSTPHRYDLSGILTPGTHTLCIRVDNRKQYDISRQDLAHSYTDGTQVIWNGVLGRMSITSEPRMHIRSLRVDPSVDGTVGVQLEIGSDLATWRDAKIELSVCRKGGREVLTSLSNDVRICGDTVLKYYMRVDRYNLWSEFNPDLYTVHAKIADGLRARHQSAASENFGFRKLDADGNVLTVNGLPLFLRGTLECCVFPLSGTPPTDKAGWEKVFDTARSYGLNHLRFHSWCPPEAAFDVADEKGFYLQIELPVWSRYIGRDSSATDFMRSEGERIMAEYGNHPSFCFWSMGNELRGDFSILRGLVDYFKSRDDRHLYAATTFTFEKGHGTGPEPCDDFFVSQWTDNGWVRGQGVFNEYSPSFNQNYSKSLIGIDVPLITHEVGQYSIYPSMREIDKYTGTLIPLNLMAIREDLEEKALLQRADSFTLCSGKLAAILYKEEIERALKTPGISGFQLLDIHDFPGQGTAHVGILDSFWDNKGIMGGDEFRSFCSPVVPLLYFDKAAYPSSEHYVANVALSNYSGKVMNDVVLQWTVKSDDGIFASGCLEPGNIGLGLNTDIGTVDVPLDSITEAKELTVELSDKGNRFSNSWKIWVYPTGLEISEGDVCRTSDFHGACKKLAEGRKVLFTPDWHTMKGIEGKFVPVFWSPVHFKKQAGTMGILCDPNHPALHHFPTESHTDWQWWSLNVNSIAIIMDGMTGGSSIVDVIDNFERNHRLSCLFEGKVGPGKLMVCSMELNEDDIVSRQMLYSILEYMNSDEFNPPSLSGFEGMADTFGTVQNVRQSAASIY